MDQWRGEEYDRLLWSMRTVTEATRSMQLTVQGQGELVDRIDYNLEHAGERTGAAVRRIAVRDASENIDRRKIVLLLLVVMIVVLTSAVIFKPKQ